MPTLELGLLSVHLTDAGLDLPHRFSDIYAVVRREREEKEWAMRDPARPRDGGQRGVGCGSTGLPALSIRLSRYDARIGGGGGSPEPAAAGASGRASAPPPPTLLPPALHHRSCTTTASTAPPSPAGTAVN